MKGCKMTDELIKICRAKIQTIEDEYSPHQRMYWQDEEKIDLLWDIIEELVKIKDQYKKHLNELLYDIELVDIEKDQIKDKYLNKLEKIR